MRPRKKGEETMEQDNYKIEYSPLNRKITREGVTVEVLIYRGEDDPGWMLEIVDWEGGSTVWDDSFATDEAALAEAMSAIETEGMASFAELPLPPAKH